MKVHIFGFALFLMSAGNIYAYSPDVLWGTWETVAGRRISVEITRSDKADVYVDGKLYHSFSYEYIYPKLKIYPFVHLVFSERNGAVVHRISLVPGEDANGDLLLIGFYELSIVLDEHEDVLVFSNNIQLRRSSKNAH